MSGVKVSVGVDSEENPVVVVIVGDVTVTCPVTKDMVTAHYVSTRHQVPQMYFVDIGGDKKAFNSCLNFQSDKDCIDRVAPDLCLCGGFISPTAAAFRMNCSVLNVELMVEREILIGVSTNVGYHLPEFQFNADGVNAGCFSINSELRGYSALEKIHFYVTGREDLGGRTPIQVIAGVSHTQRLMEAARAYREEVKCCEK